MKHVNLLSLQNRKDIPLVVASDHFYVTGQQFGRHMQ